jgi:RNA polymerase sigma-70 factor (ECF subfamily)
MFEANTINREFTSSLDDDERLVQAAQKNPADFKPIYQKWLKPVYRYFYFRVGNERDAEDLTSQVFLKVYEDLPHYRSRSCFSAWLFTIARARAVDFYRKQNRQIPLTEVDPAPDEVAYDDDLRQVLALIHLLPPDQQELIRLRFVAELSYREIGSLLHRKEDAVRKAISRILDRIQTEIDHE